MNTVKKSSYLHSKLTLLIATFICVLVVWLSPIATADGNIEDGFTKSTSCAACHGEKGIAISESYPNLAAQPLGFVKKELKEFQENKRIGSVMNALVGDLSEQDMADLDAFYASLPAPKGKISKNEIDKAEYGENIYRAGFEKFNIPSCMSCHGPSGAGIGPKYPRIAGQSQLFITNELIKFKEGTRTSDEMNSIAFSLSEEQITALAIYISALSEE